ncbi:MAG: DUF2070 family protein [Nitrososphaerota archaeon]|nr:DUF2070 family protein [Nitrososphaerota archaeon]
MSSTSSTEQDPKPRSATEILASRYRHLFVLPSYPALLVYGGVASLVLSVISRGAAGIATFLSAFVVLVLSAAAISSALQVTDKSTIATFRRAQALLLAADLLWLLVAAVGAVYAFSSGSQYAVTNSILFGGFICSGFEFLVIQGAFHRNAPLALGLSSIHPVATLLIVRLPELADHIDPAALASGAMAFALVAAFPILLRRRRTSLGHDALSLFQAFMKTWAGGNSDELEMIISDHAEEVEVTTKVLRFGTKEGEIFLVLPGVHPGPFHPVGSYDLPGAISRAFKDMGPAMTLHRPGGHERNLATRAETSKYVEGVSQFARSIPMAGGVALRGPLSRKVGNASVSAAAFDNDLMVTVSFAPLGSDDIDTSMEAELAGPASEAGFDLSIVDAHNSIDPRMQSPVTDDPGWKRLFEAARSAERTGFSVAYSHSGEVGFSGRRDLTENGLALLMLQGRNAKWALVLADANNSVPDLRRLVREALAESGYELIEFCTSDSHNLAARGLTAERGYEALGEATRPESIAELVAKLAKLSESRLAPAKYGSASSRAKVRVFGVNALEEFAAITQASSRLARTYFRVAGIATALLLAASLLL